MPDSRRGRREAFESEILPHLDIAFRFARALTGNELNAEDLVQAAFQHAFAAFKGYQHRSSARAWLLTIVRRTYLNDRRADQGQRKIIVIRHTGADDGKPFEIGDMQTRGTEDEMLQTLDQELVLRLLSELPEAYCSAIALVDMEGLGYAEAGSVLDCPLGTVMSHLHRGRELLAQELLGAQKSRLDVSTPTRRDALPPVNGEFRRSHFATAKRWATRLIRPETEDHGSRK